MSRQYQNRARCQHERGEPQEIEEQVDGAHVLTLFRPLRNLEKCQERHGSDHQVRGVLRISLGLERLDAELKAARNRQILIAIVTILGVTGALVIFNGSRCPPADRQRGRGGTPDRWGRLRGGRDRP